ncbi:hypothetical protein BGZ99_002542 [Dissophora globulifera]|uniref:Uncharacterized protein n=1 Tax=Dissophora globulifera TaxID=979702 RepID=A0A9P6UXA0_9FUNG|nr:hypothetical protein BGZ99_002542 [Dissophora globulifera]
MGIDNAQPNQLDAIHAASTALNSPLSQPSSFQAFRASDHPTPVQIPTVRHPATGEHYVIWTDITDCFPGVIRVQHGDIYVSLMRDQNLYRVRPHGIKHHPGVILDIIYGDQLHGPPRKQGTRHRSTRKGRNSAIGSSTSTTNAAIATTHARDSDHDAESSTSSQSQHLEGEASSDIGRAFRNGHVNRDGGLNTGVDSPAYVGSSGVSSPYEALTPEPLPPNPEHSAEDEEDINGDHGAGEWEERQPEDDSDDEVQDFAVASEDHITKAPHDSDQHLATDKKEPEQQPVHPDNQLGGNDALSGLSHQLEGVVAPVDQQALQPREDTEQFLRGTAKADSMADAITAADEALLKLLKTDAADSPDSHALWPYKDMALPPQGLRRLPAGRTTTLTIADVLRKRVKDIITKRFHWIESSAPKLFVILPANYVTPTNADAVYEDTVVSALNWVDFAVHFLCDCGGITGTHSHTAAKPHWNLKDAPWGHPINSDIERRLIDKFGEYMMGILETFKYGVELEGDDAHLSIQAEEDPELQKRISWAIKYLSRKGIATVETHLAVTSGYEEAVLQYIPAIPPLVKQDMDYMRSNFFSDSRRTVEDVHSFLTPNRDVRWVCLGHCLDMSPQLEWAAALRFASDPASATSEFSTLVGAFRAVVTSRVRARDFYQLAEKLTSTCVIRLFLDWDLTAEDEEELRVAVSKFSAVCVRLQVRAASTNSDQVVGFQHGYSAIIFEAMRNRNIEAFVMAMGVKDDQRYYSYDEHFDLKQSFSSDEGLVRYKRSHKTDKMNLRILVTDIDRAVLKIRSTFKGLHNFTKLRLTMSHVWEYVTIKFLKPGQPGYEIEDTDYHGNDVLSFFEKRGNRDSVNYNCRLMGDNRFIHSKVLTSVSLGFTYAKDRNKVREVLKNNKRLEVLDLENLIQDDPSQIFESLKALLVNHPTLHRLAIKQRHHRANSDFTWSDVSDPAKMEVTMIFYESDKVVSMFQKYATSLSSLNMCGISAQDAAVLERSLRPKKGPFKLRNLWLSDVHLMEQAALDDLKKIILRGDFAKVTVSEDITKRQSDRDAGAAESSETGRTKAIPEKVKQRLETEAAIKTTEFLMSIRTKVTGVYTWGSSSRRVVDVLEKRRPLSVVMPMLKDLSFSGDPKLIADYTWLKEILLFKSASLRAMISTHLSRKGKSHGKDKDKDQDKGLQELVAAVSNATGPVPRSRLAQFVQFALSNCDVNIEPLRDISLMDVEINAEDWDFLLKVLDFGHIKRFRMELANEITGEMLLKLPDVMPLDMILDSFSISAPGPTADESLLCQKLILMKLAKTSKSRVVLVNGYIS